MRVDAPVVVVEDCWYFEETPTAIGATSEPRFIDPDDDEHGNGRAFAICVSTAAPEAADDLPGTLVHELVHVGQRERSLGPMDSGSFDWWAVPDETWLDANRRFFRRYPFERFARWAEHQVAPPKPAVREAQEEIFRIALDRRMRPRRTFALALP